MLRSRANKQNTVKLRELLSNDRELLAFVVVASWGLGMLSLGGGGGGTYGSTTAGPNQVGVRGSVGGGGGRTVCVGVYGVYVGG